MRIRKGAGILLLLLCCLTLSGCRVRTTGDTQDSESPWDEAIASADSSTAGSLREDTPDKTDETDRENSGDIPGGRTKENPEASRKEYDENAPAEIVSGTDRKLHGEGEGEGAPIPDEDSPVSVNRLDEKAEETATQTIAAEQAEKKGVSDDAAEADSALTYYSVLLQDRTGSLFECQRLYVYWETKEDHVTVFRTSPEHRLILDAGAYDVSSRLLEENLHVDDGWISRKNPGVIVKIVDGSVLGSGAASTAVARNVLSALVSREGWAQIDAIREKKVLLLSEELLEAPHLQTAAMLLIAKTANPELFADTDPDRAIRMLTEEATGSIPAGIYYFSEQGGF